MESFAHEDADVTADEIELRRRMAAHEIYAESVPGFSALRAQQQLAKVREREFNLSGPADPERRQQILSELLGSAGDGLWIEPPLHVSYGTNIHFGDNVFVNVGFTAVDDVPITVGDRVMFAPHVTVTTTGHPVHPELRRGHEQFSAEVVIEDDVWVGSHAVILPGVRIGRGSVVGAGSIVTRDVPPMVVVAGSPARIIRAITDDDRAWTYRAPGQAT